MSSHFPDGNIFHGPVGFVKKMEGKIKFVFVLLFLIIFSSGCLYDDDQFTRVSDLDERNDDPTEHSAWLDSTVESDPEESIRIDQERRIAEGQEIVAANIQYREALDRNNEMILQSRDEGTGTPPVNGASIREKQKKAKAHHFSQLERLLKLK